MDQDKSTQRNFRNKTQIRLCQMSKGNAHLTGSQITSEYKYSEVKIPDSTMKRCLLNNNLGVLVENH